MLSTRNSKVFAALVASMALCTALNLTREAWLPFLGLGDTAAASSTSPPVGEAQKVKLSTQAQSNLGLVAKPLKAGTYWRTIQVPGVVVDRPGHCDINVVAPATSVVTKIHFFPGDTVLPGDTLFTLRLLSETMLATQSELFKTTQEIEFTKEQRRRLSDPSLAIVISENKIIELDYQLLRLNVAVQAARQELLTRGLTTAQIDGVAQGKYISEITVQAPQQSTGENQSAKDVHPVHPGPSPDHPPHRYFEFQDLKVELGQQVQVGQTLGHLSNHQSLFIEGRAFRQETPLVEKAIKEGWPLEVEFMEESANGWPELKQAFTIRHMANTIDSASRTFAFYLPLDNQSRSYEKEGKTRLLWRFRPGQKVRLHVKVEKFDNVFVLPSDAVVREGAETYAFRQNGDYFERNPVRVLYQDRLHAVVANDGSVPAGIFVAQSCATQLNRVLKTQSGPPPGFHVHADGTIHANH
jgi:biotin carboxyl carrier protein